MNAADSFCEVDGVLARKSGRTALLIEPSLLERNRLLRGLHREGFERVLQAEDGPTGVTLMAAEPVDLVLTRWDAEGISGLELLRALRKRGRNRHVPVVVLDGGLPRQTIVSAIKAGVAGRLPLPSEPGSLRKVLQSILPLPPLSEDGPLG